LLIVAAFPILTATFVMLLLDRYLGMHFFTNDAGGNQMMYVNLFWAWGHPEVYILVLPAFGIFSEVVATFSGKGLFSYRSMVLATLGICILSFTVWLHHFFTMGAGADVNSFFGIMSAIIAVPTGVKIFNWLFTMFRGRIVFTTPMLFAVGFMVTFVIGGMTGVLLAVPPVDFVLHNSVFLVAHFHNVIIGGVLFGALAGYNYWFPKAFGFTLDEWWGKASFWCWLVGFYVAFMPLYVLGLMGMTRRLQHIPDPSWRPLLLVAEAGAVVVFLAILCMAAQLYVSIRTREQRRDLTGDAWKNGRTLEWSTSSPPPAYNYAVLPRVETIDAFWEMKRRGLTPGLTPGPTPGLTPGEPAYQTIEMPRNSPIGIVIAFFAVIAGFSAIWYISWLAILGLLAILVTVLVFGWSENREREIPANEIARMERARLGLGRPA
jgi:cytochrome o ubiquinol oxidase subunit 1